MNISEVIAWITTNWATIVDLYLKIVGLASVIVALTPTLRDDDALKWVVRFMGKYIALNTNKGTTPNA